MKIKRPFKGKFKEFNKGEKFLKQFNRGVVVFGSARSKPNSWEYKIAEQISKKLSSEGITIITGGAFGCMEAANKGAKDGESIAINIRLPKEEGCNKYTNKKISFEHFYVRKYFLLKSSKATIIMPGGFGTLDEAFETLTLMQTGKICKRPIVFVGKKYYKGLYDWVFNKLYKGSYIDKNDLDFLFLSDNAKEIFNIVKKPFIK